MRKFIEGCTGLCRGGGDEGAPRGGMAPERVRADGYMERFLREGMGISTEEEKPPKTERPQRFIAFCEGAAKHTEGSLSKDFFAGFLKMNIGAHDAHLTVSPPGYIQTKYRVDSRALVGFIEKWGSKISALVYKTGLEFGFYLGADMVWFFINESGYVWIKNAIIAKQTYRDAIKFLMDQGVLERAPLEQQEGAFSLNEISGLVPHTDIKIPIKNMTAYRQLEASVKAKSMRPLEVGGCTVGDWQFMNGFIQGSVYAGKEDIADFCVSAEPSGAQLLRVGVYADPPNRLGEAVASLRAAFSRLGITA